MRDEALTAEDVAAMLRVSKNSVYRLVQSGEIASYHVGRKLRFTRQAVDDYIEKSLTENAPSAGMTPANDSLVAKTGASASGSQPSSAAQGAPSSPSPLDAPAELPSAFALPRERAFVIAGNDVSGDLLANALNQQGVPTTRAYAGSYTALANLYAQQADAALVHLFDGRTNSYNVPYVQRIAPGTPVVVIRILKRRQGFIVREGNPKRITTWGSLLHERIRLANRARGCGTRVLLDEKLLSLEARPETIAGYGTECPTGAQAAALVASGAADVCVGTERIASYAPGLEFVPMQTEWLDLAIEKSERTKPLVRSLKEIAASDSFRHDIAQIEGCEAVNTGAVVYEC